MKKLPILMVMLAFVALASNASATVCWNMSPFIDNIEVEATSQGNSFLLHGKWVAPGSYHLPIVGSANEDASAAFRLGVHGTNNTGSFLGFMDCILDATIDGTLNGPWTLSCGAGGFTNTGTLVPIPCPIPLSSRTDGRRAGE